MSVQHTILYYEDFTLNNTVSEDEHDFFTADSVTSNEVTVSGFRSRRSTRGRGRGLSIQFLTQGRNLRGVVRHFLVENVHPKDSIADILLMLGGRFDESRGDTLQFHAKESYIREIGTRVIELKEQRVGPNKLKLVYPDAWMAKLKAWVDSWPDQKVFENVLIKSSCLPYDHKLAGVPRGSQRCTRLGGLKATSSDYTCAGGTS
ncbi:hypothetical protein P9112_010002 [Eukaryota sp. TZLM1-RC]